MEKVPLRLSGPDASFPLGSSIPRTSICFSSQARTTEPGLKFCPTGQPLAPPVVHVAHGNMHGPSDNTVHLCTQLDGTARHPHLLRTARARSAPSHLLRVAVPTWLPPEPTIRQSPGDRAPPGRSRAATLGVGATSASRVRVRGLDRDRHRAPFARRPAKPRC